MTGPADTVEAAETQVNVPLVPCSALSIYSAPSPLGAERLEEGGSCVASPSSGRASVYLSNGAG